MFITFVLVQTQQSRRLLTRRWRCEDIRADMSEDIQDQWFSPKDSMWYRVMFITRAECAAIILFATLSFVEGLLCVVIVVKYWVIIARFQWWIKRLFDIQRVALRVSIRFNVIECAVSSVCQAKYYTLVVAAYAFKHRVCYKNERQKLAFDIWHVVWTYIVGTEQRKGAIILMTCRLGCCLQD